jgi:hypothetical protein
MFFPRFKAISNKSDWKLGVRLRDKTTKELIDLSVYTLEIVIYDERDKCSPISGSTSDGKITLPDINTALWIFRKSDLTNLSAGTYKVAFRASLGVETDELFIATLPVLDGGFTS